VMQLPVFAKHGKIGKRRGLIFFGASRADPDNADCDHPENKSCCRPEDQPAAAGNMLYRQQSVWC